MRKIFTLLLLVAGFAATAQRYNNEWIQHGQTYYKFKVANDGVYRISKSLLDANGLGSVPVQFLELWRNGEKVPFYPSVSSGVLPAAGYLEFWGERNDGKADKALYRLPQYQHTTKYSLQTDTAAYFLSVNTDQSGFRYNEVFNNVSGHGAPEPYFMHTVDSAYKNLVMPNNGFGSLVGVYVYSSSYDKGEFFSSGDIGNNFNFITALSNLKVYAGGPASMLKFGATGNAPNARHIKVRVNGVEVKDTIMDYFDDLVSTAPVSTSDISSGTASVQVNNTSTNGNDRMQMSFIALTYPRTFDFNGLPNFKFQLPAKSTGYYLEISNFAFGSVQPVLYDRLNGDRFVGELSGNIVQFALPPSSNPRDLILVNQEGTNIRTVTELVPRTFRNYKQAVNQGDYLIITHSSLFAGTAGNNPVEDYKAYRESAAGGGYKVLIADIDDLVEQFAFGIKKHPLSVRNFLRYARDSFATKPKFAFLIGKGVLYTEYQRADRNPTAYPLGDRLNIIPTFGSPGSDNLLSAEDLTIPVAATPIGRLSVVSGKEIEDYLEKLKEYEANQKNAPNTLAARQWMKNIVHVTGSSDAYLGTVLCNYMDIYKHIIEDTLYGGKVNMFCKTSTNPIEQVSSEKLSSLINEGVSILTYFGHSSATTLEFNIDNPESYNNQGKYPVFFVNGCYAGNFFSYYPQRFTTNETLSEKFTLAKQRGTIAFVASTHYGIVNYLNLYLTYLYDDLTGKAFDRPLGETLRKSFQDMISATGDYDFYSRLHAEEMTLHGDPAITLNVQPQPDYVIEESLIKLNPAFISLADTTYSLKVKTVNLGQAVSDSVRLEIKQFYPNGTTGIIYREKLPGIRFADSIELNVPIRASRDKGQNRIVVTIDADNAVVEMAENNNSVTKEFYIFEEEARPAFPYNYSIIDKPTQKLFASTANPLSTLQNYVMEIDTSIAFNSAAKVTRTASTVGGIMEFNTDLTYVDSTVYFWRVAPVPPPGKDYTWSNSSFMYRPNTEGYNQSTFFQHTGSTTERLLIDSASQTFKFLTNNTVISAKNCIFQGFVCETDADFSVQVNNNDRIRSACVGHSLVFNVFDSVTMEPWSNVDANGNPLYRFHSGLSVCGKGGRQWNFEYSYMTPADRKLAMDFMDSIPNGAYVVVRSFDYHNPNSYGPTWINDTTLYGENKSLYHKLLEAGFVGIDSINQNRAWILIYQKGSNSLFSPKYAYGKDFGSKPVVTADIITPDTLGYLRSPKFGPSKRWKTMEWNGVSMESPSGDNPTIDIIGIDYNNVETKLYTLDKNTHDFDISAVDARFYPYIVLKMRNTDPVNLTPYQLKYWRVYYDPIPEGALAPNIYIVSKDTMELGEKMHFGIGYKNISYTDFDSMLVKINVIDQRNVTHTIPLAKFKPIIVGDTIKIDFEIDTKDFSGNNVLYVEVNPDENQPEHYHFNNFVFKNFYVRPDRVNPLMDVTFDGVHILNGDIISAKPHIQIKLKDDAKYLLLNDTLLSNVQIKYPDGTLRTYHFDSDTLRFIPATSGSDNTATIDFMPQFNKQYDPAGDDYELIVNGKDRSGNKAGDIAYRVGFKIITKPMISNMLNYPNPFSTSTAFVFTLTGSEVPQNIRIQILTVTGKIVREITMNELGPLHIGRNITEFKWDGTDQYGQKLGNGVYLYRVVTSMNGKSMDKYKASSDDTDKYFNNGYGKMYLMR